MTGRAFRPTCSAGSASPISRPAPAPSNHMGLGIFIAQSLLERSGADLTFDNLVEGGAHVVISWKRANLEAEARPDAAAAESASGRGAARKREATGMNASDRPHRAGGHGGRGPAVAGPARIRAHLLIVDDDAPLCQRLARAMERRGFVVSTADGVAAGVAAATAHPPAFAVVDLRLGDGSGLDVVSALRGARPGARIVVLTGYGNIATAVAAVKAGALDYLPKPADADAVERALLAQEGETPEPPEDPMSADRVRWEHIQRIFELCERNVSETARRLKMHRRTLQRILSKHAPRS